jgi:integrase
MVGSGEITSAQTGADRTPDSLLSRKIVQSLLGHASIVQTMDTYSHLLEDIGGDAVGGLDEAFG